MDEHNSNIPSRLVVKLLSNTELFGGLDEAVLESLSPELEILSVPGGQVLMREKDPGDCMYTVISGRLHAFVSTADESDQLVGEIAAGESVGEMALITGEERSATVCAVRDSELVRISKSGFERLVQSRPEVMLPIARVIVMRLKKMLTATGPGAAPLKTISIFPAGPDAPLASFAAQFVSVLSKTAEVLHLNSGLIRSLYDLKEKSAHEEGICGNLLSSDEAQSSDKALSSWLSAREREYRFIVYESDPDLTPWTERCMRQADRILLVARSTPDKTCNPVETKIYTAKTERLAVGKSLVIVQENDTALPADTTQWVRHRQVDRIHHIRMDADRDLQRLVRMNSGEAMGLVLGGGGARGFAHIGILRALKEAQLPVDAVCGVSIGAIISAQFAMEWPPDRMLEMCREWLVRRRARNDRTLPLVAMSKGKRFDRALMEFYGDTRIEDLWLNYFSVSCNLTTTETVVHRTGSLFKAVRASNAAPVLFPPSVEDGELLVDGGIVNNQPGDIMRRFCSGRVMVANVSPDKDMGVDPELTEMPSAADIMLSRLNPFRRRIKVPNIPALMMRTIMVGSQKKSLEVEAAADFYLHPPISGFRLSDDTKIDEIAAVGYRHAAEKIEAWDKAGRL